MRWPRTRPKGRHNPMSTWQRLAYNGAWLFQVGILPDGTLRNPNNYPEGMVRAAILDAEARQHEKRSKAARKASATRSRRQSLKVQDAAQRLLADKRSGPRRSCYICGRHLDDTASIERGIGSECWQNVLAVLTELRSASYA
jgi:hypothetical protein